MDEALNASLHKLGLSLSSVLLPAPHVDLGKWAVVACDQYTSQHEYWKDAENTVKDAPSTLGLIFPEVYLETEDEDKKADRIKAIQAKMLNYLNNGLFNQLTDTLILTRRSFAAGATRHGLVLSVDLEHYDFKPGSQTLVRATEGTIVERLPPRIRIRQGAPIELPHIMLLIDDGSRSVIEPLIEKAGQKTPAYDFDLMKNGGRLTGWAFDDKDSLESVIRALEQLSDSEAFRKRHGVNEDKGVLLYAVGDGNHSLATAKACWEEIKKTLSKGEQETHPARYALVEVVNVHDQGLFFEPIHRVVFKVDPEKLIEAFINYYSNIGCICYLTSEEAANEAAAEGSTPSFVRKHFIPFVSGNKKGCLVVENPPVQLEVGTLQKFLDDYIPGISGSYVDYVHGRDVTEQLGSVDGNMGFFLPSMDKNDLFHTVVLDGALPRKTFSMGEAHEKRFYFEARRIAY